MSKCGCKDKGESSKGDVNIDSGSTGLSKINNIVFRVFMFGVALILVPLLLPLIIWLLFKTIVLNDSINLLPSLVKLGDVLKKKNQDDDEDDEDDEEDYEYELENVEEIKIK